MSKIIKHVNDSIEATINGIPCQAVVTVIAYEKPSYDFPGYSDETVEIFDRKGYKAKWLENMMTHKEYEKIIEDFYGSL